jgi:hypothetical protein
MIHPHTEVRFINDAIGYGVFATQSIPKGTIIWTLCELDRLYNAEDIIKINPAHHPYLLEYSYVDTNGHLVFCWDHGRYVNHSCNPTNVDFGSADVSIARRDILAGEQITCDYGVLNILADLECRCQQAQCRGFIYTDDLVRYSDSMRAELQKILPFMTKVDQPLYDFIRDKESYDAYTHQQQELPEHKNFLCPDHHKLLLKKLFQL